MKKVFNKKEYTWDLHMSTEIFFDELEGKAYRQTFSQTKKHWGENCIFYKKKSNNVFYLIYHKANMKNSFARLLKGKIYPTSDGIQIKAKLELHTFVKVFLTFWNLYLTMIFFILLFKNLLMVIIIIPFLVFPLIFLTVFKEDNSVLLNLMNEIK